MADESDSSKRSSPPRLKDELHIDNPLRNFKSNGSSEMRPGLPSTSTKDTDEIVSSFPKSVSPTVRSMPTALAGHNKNKRNFDVAFLAGTHGNTFDSAKVLPSNSEEEKEKTPIGEQTLVRDKCGESHETLNLNDSCKSAFKKVKKHQESEVTTIKQKDINGQVVCASKSVLDQDRDITNTFGNKVNNNNSPLDEDKDNESNRLIGLQGNIQSIEHRGNTNNNNQITSKSTTRHNFTASLGAEDYKKGLECASREENISAIPPMAKEDHIVNTRPIPPLLTTLPHSLLQHQAGLHLQTSTDSPTFNLLQFPALKKMLHVQSSQQKQVNHSAFSALKAQQATEHLRSSAAHTSLHPPHVLSSPAIVVPPTPPLFPTVPPQVGLASLIGSPLLPPPPAAVVAAASSVRSSGPGAGATSSGSFVPSNTCAKCGVTFRMTSDLVYHMRTHHAKNVADTSYEKRRHVDSLTCTVCGENFRERHHLTRHMTAHAARKGENPDDKAKLIPLKGTTSQPTDYVQQNKINYGGLPQPSPTSSQTSLMEESKFKVA